MARRGVGPDEVKACAIGEERVQFCVADMVILLSIELLLYDFEIVLEHREIHRTVMSLPELLLKTDCAVRAASDKKSHVPGASHHV